MMLVGIIWAATAPLLLLAAALLLMRLLAFTGWSQQRRFAFAAALVALPTGALWWSDRAEFVAACDALGAPRIYATAHADGLYLNSSTANSFGTRYLHEEGFAWMEIRSIYQRDKFERWRRNADGSMATTPIENVTARYEARESFEQPYPHTGLSMTTIVDRQDGRVLAEAGHGNFDGGRARWVLGAYGSSSCPSAFSDSEGFRKYYHLANLTLRAGERKD